MKTRLPEPALPILAIVLIVLTHSVLPLFPLPLAIPVLFLFLNRRLYDIPFRESASRAYLMYFLTGLIGLLAQAIEFGSVFEGMEPGVDQTDSLNQLSALLVATLPEILLQTILPLACGVSVFIMFGGSSGAAGSSALNTTHLQQLNTLLQRARIPEAAASLMQELLTQTESIRNSSAEFNRIVGQSAVRIGSAGKEAAGAAQQFAALTSQTAALTSDLQIVRCKITEMESDVSHLHQTVAEIGQVVDEFSEIAASRILNFTFESDRPRKLKESVRAQ